MSQYTKYPNTSGTTGVASLNAQTGALTLLAGPNITITPGVGTLTIAATGSSGGTVTSVALTAPSILNVAGSPITSSGTLALTLADQSANLVFAGPASGAATTPTFRSLVSNDIPTLTSSKISDFQTSVSANTDVTANTAARHNAVTLGTANGLSLSVQVLSLGLSSTSTTGALSSTDWNTFNSKQSALTFGSISTSTTGVTVGSGANSTVGPNVTVNVQTASGSQPGLLSATDWTTFNGKQASGNYITALTGDATASGPGSATLTLANSGVTAGSYGSVTVDAKGRVTAGNSLPPGFQFITSGTTFTTAATITTATRFKFTLLGGGGGGAGINTSNRGATGGGGSGTCIVSITGLTASTGYTIAIGAGGAAGSGVTPTAGSDGGNTTLLIGATTYTAGGGKGGPVGTAGNGGLGGGSTNGTINIAGSGGGAVNAVNGTSGQGGSSLMGLGGASVSTTQAGIAGSGYGGGGSGGQGLLANGGAGSAGAILVEWVS